MLYLHTQRLRDVMHIVEQTNPAYIKAIDPDPESARRCMELGVRIIARHAGPWEGGAPQDSISPSEFVQECMLQPYSQYVWAFETPNEPHPGDADWMATCVQLFRVRSVECVVGNWANGWDGFLVPGATYYACHEYGWLFVTSQQPYMAFRHRGWFENGVLRQNPNAMLFVTEFGVTQLAWNAQGEDIGWQTLPSNDHQAYWDSVVEYVEGLQRKPYVLGAFLYNWAVYPPWETFEHVGTSFEQEVMRLSTVRQLVPTDPVTEEQTEEVTVPDYHDIGPGIATKARQLGMDYTGMQLSEKEIYLKDGKGNDTYSYCVFERCEIRYYPDINYVVAIPFV